MGPEGVKGERICGDWGGLGDLSASGDLLGLLGGEGEPFSALEMPPEKLPLLPGILQALSSRCQMEGTPCQGL